MRMDVNALDSAFNQNNTYLQQQLQQQQRPGSNNNNDHNTTPQRPDAPMQPGMPNSAPGAEGDVTRAIWNPDREALLAEICKDLKREGHSLPGQLTFTREAWESARQRFTAAAGVEWSVAQLKARYQRLRMDYEAFKLLKDAVINQGGRWNSERLVLEATEEVKQLVTAQMRKDLVYFHQPFTLYPVLSKLFDEDWDTAQRRWVPRRIAHPSHAMRQTSSGAGGQVSGHGEAVDSLAALTRTQLRRRRGSTQRDGPPRTRGRPPRVRRRDQDSPESSIDHSIQAGDPMQLLDLQPTTLGSMQHGPVAAAVMAHRPSAMSLAQGQDPAQSQTHGAPGGGIAMERGFTSAEVAAEHAQLTRTVIEANKQMLQSALKELAMLQHPRQVQVALSSFTQYSAAKGLPVRTQLLCKEVLASADAHAEVWLTLPPEQYKAYFDMKFRQKGLDVGYEER